MNNRNKAIAIRYDSQKEIAPRILAKGQGIIADEILRIADENNICIVETANLVDNLYQVDLDQVVPDYFYELLADLLLFVSKVEVE